MKLSRIAAVIAVGSVLVVGTATSRSAHAGAGCVPLAGHYVVNVTTADCTSPIGLCATGTVTLGLGDLSLATATLVALDTAPSAGMPTSEPAADASYSGRLTFTTPKGDTLVVRDLGVIDSLNGSFTELERPVAGAGTGIFANATGDFFISGALRNNQSEFDGHVYGQLCGL